MAARVRTAIRKSTKGSQASVAERVSNVAENYLLSLYILKEEGLSTSPARLAEYIRQLPEGEGVGSSLPSVRGMLRRMVREGLVTMTQNREVQFTERGAVLAEHIARRHRLAERLVVDLLGLDLHLAEIEAHRLEHAISPELEEKLRERLGNPTTCPFGHPIPGSGYVPSSGKLLTLDNARVGLTYVVHRVPEEDVELLRFLVERRVLPDEEIQVVEAGRYRGVLRFRTRWGEDALGYEAASRVWVRLPPGSP